jgi:hypothetical protein
MKVSRNWRDLRRIEPEYSPEAVTSTPTAYRLVLGHTVRFDAAIHRFMFRRLLNLGVRADRVGLMRDRVMRLMRCGLMRAVTDGVLVSLREETEQNQGPSNSDHAANRQVSIPQETIRRLRPHSLAELPGVFLCFRR